MQAPGLIAMCMAMALLSAAVRASAAVHCCDSASAYAHDRLLLVCLLTLLLHANSCSRIDPSELVDAV